MRNNNKQSGQSARSAYTINVGGEHRISKAFALSRQSLGAFIIRFLWIQSTPLQIQVNIIHLICNYAQFTAVNCLVTTRWEVVIIYALRLSLSASPDAVTTQT